MKKVKTNSLPTFAIGDYVGFYWYTVGQAKTKRRGDIVVIHDDMADVDCSGDILTVPLNQLDKLTN